MVISFVMMLGVVSAGPASPATAEKAHTDIPAAARGRHERTVVRDPFVAPGPRVVIAAASSGLRDPFATNNLAARYRTPASDALRDPFAS